ncbi:MAG TPA: hypothetical protein VMI31_07460 [Fimbriimonadaceae bacterium]|nr:hypothetical protein [Fimbriimonadaceae bacterium]
MIPAVCVCLSEGLHRMDLDMEYGPAALPLESAESCVSRGAIGADGRA